MSARFVATVGNGRLLARIGADGSLLGLSGPHLDKELLVRPVHATLELPSGRKRRIGGRGWKHRREYVRGTNTLWVMSRHATGIKVERRIAAIDDALCLAFRVDGEADVSWAHGLESVLPRAGIRFDGVWPPGFDPPPLAGATRASVVARVPHLSDRAAITGLYARSLLVIAQHHDRSGAFAAGRGDDALIAHALDVCGERGAAEDGFFEHQATAQNARRARALYGGAFHAGMPEPGTNGQVIAEVRSDLEVSGVTLEMQDRLPENMEAMAESPGHDARWVGRPPAADAGDVSRYRIKVHLRDPEATPVWASASDPRAGGQEFAFDTDPPPPPEWVRDAICYHVMVDRFARAGEEKMPPPADSTALYGGTLDGIGEHIEHIESLGCNVLWLSPVHKSPSHHGYDHEDFLEVEPRYGGDEALERLVKAAHSRGMRVLLDFVPNHTGRGHHLFRDAIEKDGDAAAYYRFWQWPHYYRSFSDVISLPELDTGNRTVQDHLVRAAQHWLTAYGADGIRCDHVTGVDPAFWVELRRGLREVKPDALILGEATGTTDWLARYAGRLDAIFDFDLTYYVRQALARGRMDAAAFAGWLEEHEHAFPGLALATVLDNHDMNRFLWMANGNVERVKLATTLLMTLPGMPVIYYGSEVGLSQRHDAEIENAEARLPMSWGGEQNQDLLEHFRRLGRTRRGSPALRGGRLVTVLADKDVFAFERVAGDERVVVALNFSEQPQRRELPGLAEPVDLGPLGSAVSEASTIRS